MTQSLVSIMIVGALCGAGGSSVDPVGLQAALDRAGFSPGIIDGRPGAKTRAALEAFQAYHGLPITGEADSATVKALKVDEHSALIRYTITAADKKLVDPPPRNWQDKARRKRLGYKSLADLLIERGHCTRALLARLNPKRNLDRLKVGDEVLLPFVWSDRSLPAADRLEIDLDRKIVHVIDADGRVAALLHCSIAKDKHKRPKGSCKVISVAKNPVYLFDPKMWPEVKGVRQKLHIPPGPRNPVGLCWIGLSLPGYGIHGTPEPEMIGKTGSHGCFRLTNWDALRLAKMVDVGTPIRFRSADQAAFARR